MQSLVWLPKEGVRLPGSDYLKSFQYVTKYKMIVDRLANASQYYPLQPLIRSGFEFLSRPDLATLKDGVHEIQGRDVFAIITRGAGVEPEAAMLEAHRVYLDIQYVISGTDTIGWCERELVDRVKDAYDGQRDLELFYDRPATWVHVSGGSFAVFLPQDIHAPLATPDVVHKVVVKVKMQSNSVAAL